VVLDHEGQEQPIELRSPRLVQLPHLVLREHAGHQHLMLHTTHFHLIPVPLAGTGCPDRGAIAGIVAISSCWAFDDPLASCPPRRRAVLGASRHHDRWHGVIMPDMKLTSASV